MKVKHKKILRMLFSENENVTIKKKSTISDLIKKEYMKECTKDIDNDFLILKNGITVESSEVVDENDTIITLYKKKRASSLGLKNK